MTIGIFFRVNRLTSNTDICGQGTVHFVILEYILPLTTIETKPTVGTLNETLSAWGALGGNVTVGEVETFVEQYFVRVFSLLYYAKLELIYLFNGRKEKVLSLAKFSFRTLLKTLLYLVTLRIPSSKLG